MSKETKKENEDVVDAKATAAEQGALAAPEATAVSAEVRVEGVRLDFPFIRIGQGMSQWRTAETRSGKPEEGALYLGKSKESNVKVGEPGKDGGVTGIILDVVEGYKEDRPYQAGNTVAPRRWVIGANGPDGKPMDEKACLEAAAAEGLSLARVGTGEFWPSGMEKTRANLSKFAYLMMLIPLPDTFDSDEFGLYPIGGRMWTTARFEFAKQYYSGSRDIPGFARTAGNVLTRVKFAHDNELRQKLLAKQIDEAAYKAEMTSFQPSLRGIVGHIYSFLATNRDGIQYTSYCFERSQRELTDEEKADFVKFLMSVEAGYADASDADPEL